MVTWPAPLRANPLLATWTKLFGLIARAHLTHPTFRGPARRRWFPVQRSFRHCHIHPKFPTLGVRAIPAAMFPCVAVTTWLRLAGALACQLTLKVPTNPPFNPQFPLSLLFAVFPRAFLVVQPSSPGCHHAASRTHLFLHQFSSIPRLTPKRMPDIPADLP